MNLLQIYAHLMQVTLWANDHVAGKFKIFNFNEIEV